MMSMFLMQYAYSDTYQAV